MATKTAIVIGAGVAGLTAAYELISRTDIRPIVYEAQAQVGGLAKTISYKGNRIDIGPHRFFSKSDRVMEWWQQFLPICDQSTNHPVNTEDEVMIVCPRLTRILFSNRLYDYPISPSLEILIKLGPFRVTSMGLSYCKARIFPRKEKSLDDFFTNRFGKVLFRTFFKDYTEKIWGVPCAEISPEWGTQRIKGLSVGKAITHLLWSRLSHNNDIAQRDKETSLISRFLYPKLGSGQMWDKVARIILARGGQIHCNQSVFRLLCDSSKIISVDVLDKNSGEIERVDADYVISTMPVRDLAEALGDVMPDEIRWIAEGLIYRDHIMVGLLATEMKRAGKESMKANPCRLPDNWIYVQDKRVRLGRLHIVNNWSPAMIRNPNTVWLGLEYFCTYGDDLWSMPNKNIIRLATDELSGLGLIDTNRFLDATVVRTANAYPAYFGTYDQFDKIRSFVGSFGNLFLVGRNGMHRYNNMDHSVLSGMLAAESIICGDVGKDDLWAVNAEQTYHEVKT
jgi:protoporphyrinogen oxidase